MSARPFWFGLKLDLDLINAFNADGGDLRHDLETKPGRPWRGRPDRLRALQGGQRTGRAVRWGGRLLQELLELTPATAPLAMRLAAGLSQDEWVGTAMAASGASPGPPQGLPRSRNFHCPY
jgi:hypothetical protein